MLDRLSGKLGDLIRQIGGKAHISEKNIQDAINEIKIALLEADVSLRVVRRFVNQATEEALGEKVLRSVSPGQQFVKILYDRMVALLGGENQGLSLKGPDTQSVILLAGLQGSGKTTTAAKLALHLKGKGRKPLLVAADLLRPAAVEQLQQLGAQTNVPVAYYKHKSALEICQEGFAEAGRTGHDVVILDTAGRLHIDEAMMDELAAIDDALQPAEVLLVVDAMTGQEAVNVALSFLDRIEFDGLILTKMDGDARGGAALSMKAVTGRPIKLASIGEKMNDLEVFHPERVASRILGMGDIVTLVEKAEQSMTEEKARKLEEKLRKHKFDFDDFLEQMQQLKEMGGLSKVLEMVPGMGQMARGGGMDIDDSRMKTTEAIIQSMTPGERHNPGILNASRKRRIAAGSGTSTQEVNQLVKQFAQMQKMMKAFTGGKSGPQMGMLKRLFPF